jgi:hypothetical protein
MSAIAMPSAKEFIALLQQWSPEERAEIGVALGVATATKKTVTKTAAPASQGEERPPVDLSARPEMPEDPELDEDFCHGRVYKSFKSDESAAASFRAAEEAAGRPVPASEKSFYLPGFGTKIYVGTQCSKKASGGQTLCSDCSNHLSEYEAAGSKGHGTGKKAWYGVIGEAPPADAHFCGSTWAEKKYNTEFGMSPSSASRSSGSKKEPKAKVEKPAKEEKVKAVIPPKPTAPKPAKAAVVPPAVEKKPVQVIADDLTLNPVLDCFINSEGVCFYADLDETTLEPIPDMSRIIGSIPKGMDPEAATEADFKKAEE